MIKEPFYDPAKSYYENYDEGPFGAFADGQVIKRTGEPSEEFLGHKVYTRFGIPAGPLLNSKYVKAALDKGFDLPVYKTVRSGIHKSHAYPNVVPIDVKGDLTIEKASAGVTSKDQYENPIAITNSFGVPSAEPSIWQADAAEAVAHAKTGQLVGLSFQGTRWGQASVEDYIEDWVTVAKLANETKAHFLEANLSCPNEGTSDLLCFDVERVGIIARKVKAAIGDTPLFLKTAYFDKQDNLITLVNSVGAVVDGFATINTIPAAVRDKVGEQALKGEGRLVSGICGSPIKWAGLEMVNRLHKLRTEMNLNYTIVGVGGVTAVNDFSEYIEEGADVVMSATGAMWNPNLGAEVYKLGNRG